MKLSLKPVRASRAEGFQGPYGGSQWVLTLYRIYTFCFQVCNRLPEVMKNGDRGYFLFTTALILVLYYLVLFMSILEGFVPKFGCHLALRIPQSQRCRLKCAITIDHRKKHKTLSYLRRMTVVRSQKYTTGAVCGNRGVQPGELLCRTRLQIPVKEAISPSQRCHVR